MNDVEIIAAELKDEVQSALLAYSVGEYEFDGSTLIFTPSTPVECFSGALSSILLMDQIYHGHVHTIDDSAKDQNDPAFAVSGKYFSLIKRSGKKVFIKVYLEASVD